nr:hypothetical protein [Corynebacterium lactis]
MSDNFDLREFQTEPESGPELPKKKQGALWALLVILLIVIGLIAAGIYLGINGWGKGTGSETAASAGASTSKRTTTVTKTATETSEKKSSKEDRCAPEVLNSARAKDLVVKYCDGEWAHWGVYQTGARRVQRWNGAVWVDYEPHGMLKYGSFACFDLDRARRDGVPAAIRSELLECDSDASASTKTSAATTSTTTATRTSTAAKQSSAQDRCSPEMFPKSRISSESDPDLGKTVVKACDGEWALWGVYGVGGFVLSKWDGSQWQDYDRFTESQTHDEACTSLERAKRDGLSDSMSETIEPCG